MEPMSDALVGGFFTTESPGKPCLYFFICYFAPKCSPSLTACRQQPSACLKQGMQFPPSAPSTTRCVQPAAFALILAPWLIMFGQDLLFVCLANFLRHF